MIDKLLLDDTNGIGVAVFSQFSDPFGILSFCLDSIFGKTGFLFLLEFFLSTIQKRWHNTQFLRRDETFLRSILDLSAFSLNTLSECVLRFFICNKNKLIGLTLCPS
ncbi:MAG: hypothetical protein WCY58_13315 [Mariniphaga sp.]